MDRCELCRKAGTPKNRLNKHHIRGKKYPNVMVVHSSTCHWFAQWVTNTYLQLGIEQELDDRRIVYLYHRVICMRDGDDFILPN